MVVRRAGDDHRNPGRMHDGAADRAQQHPGEPAAAVAANHHKLGSLGLFEQPGCWSIADDDLLHDDIGVPVLKSERRSARTSSSRSLKFAIRSAPSSCGETPGVPCQSTRAPRPSPLRVATLRRRRSRWQALRWATHRCPPPRVPRVSGVSGRRHGSPRPGIARGGPGRAHRPQHRVGDRPFAAATHHDQVGVPRQRDESGDDGPW